MCKNVMINMHLTKCYQDFVDGCGELNYHEIYEMSQVAQGHVISGFLKRKKANGASGVNIIGCELVDFYFRLTHKQAVHFPQKI